MTKTNENEIYIIPSNFTEGSTLFGGLIKFRNAAEAAILAAAAGFPVMNLEVSLKIKIIILCFTALPLAVLGLIGISGEPLSSFISAFFKFLKSRRVVGKEKKKYKRKTDLTYLNSAAELLPIEKIENSVIYTKDRRYVKLIEVLPVNFMLRNAKEQTNIIYSFASYLKISPVRIQFKVLAKKADAKKHKEIAVREMESEKDENCRRLQKDYLKLINKIGSREATSRRFFIVLEYENNAHRIKDTESEAVASLQTAARTAARYLKQCGNEVIIPDNEDEFTAEVLYSIICRDDSAKMPLEERVRSTVTEYIKAGRSISCISCAEFFAPGKIDFTHAGYIVIDGIYYSYHIIPSDGYRTHVPAGWLSLLINAGDGIDTDLFIYRQPKSETVRKLGQQLRINRSRIRESSDTNCDFDDLDSAIQSGYYLKEGLADNEDFYYISILITVTAHTKEELEWRERELKKLLISKDFDLSSCNFREEQAFLSALPLAAVEKHIYRRSKRNVLTNGAASCYPFTAYELSDDNGILLGVNRYNNSLVIVDIFNSAVYRNANIAIIGTSGAGKTFTMQLMALRMRRKGIRVFIIAPLKGHEFLRACKNTGGEFIQISPASKNCINVMEIRKTDKSSDELIDGVHAERSELALKIQQLHIFFSLLIPDMNHEEKQLLDEALVKTYALKGITHNNFSLYDPDNMESYREMPILGDLFSVLAASPSTRRLANILNRLVHGSASSFNQQTNVDLENKYTVFDISELSGDLLSVGMFAALDYVWDKTKENRTEEKAIFIDECWQLISGTENRTAAEFVLEIFKIIRGYGGSAVCATQDLNDFFAFENGRYGKGIINNCKTKIILNLEDDEAQRAKDVLKLSDAEINEITHFERGSGLISTNNNNITVDFKCSELEKSLITTDRRELQELLKRQRNIKNM